MTELQTTKTPAALGFRFPAEWAAHEATLLGWPFDDDYWEGYLEAARADFERLVAAIARFEPVRLAVANEEAKADATARFAGQNVEIYALELDDIWFRDIAPLFVKMMRVSWPRRTGNLMAGAENIVGRTIRKCRRNWLREWDSSASKSLS